MSAPLFTVRVTMTDGNRAEASWAFSDRREADRKFNEVCGPLCTEAWLISWTDHPSIRGKKQLHLRRHWTASSGTDETPIWLCEVNTSDEDAPQETSDDVLDTLFDWDTLFETTPDDSDIFLFIDPDQSTSDNTYAHFEVGFRKISFGRKPRFPDYESYFHGLTFSCQWDINAPIGKTYGWNAKYKQSATVGLKRARRMTEMLEKIQSVEGSLLSRPQSFGEYVALIIKGLGFKSDVAAYRRKSYPDETEPIDTRDECLPLNGLELQNFVNQVICAGMQSGLNHRAPDTLPLSAGCGEVNQRMSKKDEIRQLAFAVSNGLTEYLEVHNKIFQESATFKSVVKNLFGRGASMSQLLDDSERLVPLWAAIHEQLETFRRMSYLSLTPDERSYFDLLSRYAMAINETVHALVGRQRLLNEGSTLTWELFQEKERLYRSAVAQYMVIGRELNGAAPIIFD